MSSERSPLQNGVVFGRDKDAETTLRASRLKRLASFKNHAFSTFRIEDYCDEAQRSFENGCFRSCVICSATAVELALKHTLIFLSEDWEQAYWEIEVKRFGFRDVIKKLKNRSSKIDKGLVDADWLRKARNQIVAHPLYIGNPFEVRKAGYIEFRDPELQIWASKIMLRDLKRLLQFIEPNKRSEIEKQKFTAKDDQGKIVEEIPFIDFLKQRKPVRYEGHDFLRWRAIQNELIEEIAFQAFKRMVRILNNLFPKPM